MRALGTVDARRKQMLLELGRQGMLKGDLHRNLQASGVREGVGALRPDRFRPAMDTTQTAMQKWVQAALNVVTGLSLKLDGNLGPISRTALRRFQRQEGIPAHGYADEKTLQILELRVGVSCPRGGHHEAVPALLRLPMRNVWMPRPKGQKGKERGEKDDELPPPAEGMELARRIVEPQGGQRRATATAASYADPAAREGAFSPDDDAVFRESLGSMRSLAFSPGFAERAAEQLAQADGGALQAEMSRWLDQQMIVPDAAAPAWLRTMRSDLRVNPGEAASLLRRAWWACHIGDAEGL